MPFCTFFTEHWKLKMANFPKVCIGTDPFHDISSPVQFPQVMYLSLWCLTIQALAYHTCFSAGQHTTSEAFCKGLPVVGSTSAEYLFTHFSLERGSLALTPAHEMIRKCGHILCKADSVYPFHRVLKNLQTSKECPFSSDCGWILSKSLRIYLCTLLHSALLGFFCLG